MEGQEQFIDEEQEDFFDGDEELYPSEEETHIINPTNLFYEDGNYYLLRDGSYQVLPEELLETINKVRDENRKQ